MNAVQQEAQKPAAPTGTAPHNPSTSREKRPLTRKAATTCEVVQLSEVPPRGAELSDDSPGNRPVSKQRDAEYDAFSGVDLELVAVIQAWAERAESVKTAACGDGQGFVADLAAGECLL